MSIDLSQHTVGPVMAVADMDRARAFYEGVLGLQPDMTGEHMTNYLCGGSAVAIYHSPDHAGKNTLTPTATCSCSSTPD